MSKKFIGAPPGKGYIDLHFSYKEEEIESILRDAFVKNLKEDDPLEGRAYLVVKEMPDALRGTVLRPTITIKSGKLARGKWANHYGYHSKYVGRASFLHMEIVHSENNWFCRIN